MTVEDSLHGIGEPRFAIIGETLAGRVVVVSYVERGDTIRVISARPATRREKMAYEEGQDDAP